MSAARVIAFAAVLLAAGCGYRPVAGRMGAEVPGNVRFAPFLVANDTAELVLSHVVGEASRGELARRGLLAVSTDDPHALRLELRLRRIGEVPAAYAPNGDGIEYFGELGADYDVYTAEATRPVVSSHGRVIPFRYDFRSNPQDVRIYRQAAVARGVREWIPQLLAETTLALRFAKAPTQATESRP
jgi:hypothetical protein